VLLHGAVADVHKRVKAAQEAKTVSRAAQELGAQRNQVDDVILKLPPVCTGESGDLLAAAIERKCGLRSPRWNRQHHDRQQCHNLLSKEHACIATIVPTPSETQPRCRLDTMHASQR